MTDSTIQWPSLANGEPGPIWTGQHFLVGSQKVPVLCYHETKSGWTDDLTKMHEDAAGQQHFIDRASRQHAIQALSPILQKKHPVILEVGCSSGFFLEELHRAAGHALLVGSDFISAPLYKLGNRLKGIPLAQFDVVKCPFDDASFDGVVLLNVLEHIQDDFAALKQVYRILKPGGVAALEVPAGPHLYDFYDHHLMHFRRYHRRDLNALARQVGFTVERSSHLGFFLYPFFSIVKKRNIKKGKLMSEQDRELLVSQQIKSVSSSGVFNLIMKMELAFGKHVQYPVGIRCLMTLRK